MFTDLRGFTTFSEGLAADEVIDLLNRYLATMSRYLNSLDGVVFAFLVITVAAAEVVVGIAIIVQVYRAGRQMDVDELNLMKE